MNKLIDKLLYRLYRKAAKKYCYIIKVKQEPKLSEPYTAANIEDKEEAMRNYHTFESGLNYIDLEETEERLGKLKAKN